MSHQSLICSVCGMIFGRASSRKRHELTKHYGVSRPYECLECQTSFSRHENLKRHQDCYHGASKVACEFCQRRFRKDYLFKHRRSCSPNLDHLLPKDDRPSRYPSQIRGSSWRKIHTAPASEAPEPETAASSQARGRITRKRREFVHETGFRPLTEVPLFSARMAIEKGDLERLEGILEGQDGPWSSTETFDRAYADARGETMLVTAVRSRCVGAVRRVLASGLKLHAQGCDRLGCPLPLAAGNGDTEIMRVLIAGGAPVDGGHACCPKPLIEAILRGEVGAVELLLQHGASVDPSPQSSHPVPLAIRLREDRMVDLLLQRGADPDRLYVSETASASEVTALYQAAVHDRMSVARDLIHRWSADVNRGDRKPLEAALLYGSAAMVDLLLAAGADLRLVTVTAWEDVWDPSFYPYGPLKRDDLCREIDRKRALLHRFQPVTSTEMDEFFFADLQFTEEDFWALDG